MIRYCPVLSVTAERVFSMSTGLEASTVTPGRTAPEASRTVPVKEACARTGTGTSRRMRIAADDVSVRIEMTPSQLRDHVAADRIAHRRTDSPARLMLAAGWENMQVNGTSVKAVNLGVNVRFAGNQLGSNRMG